jgi:hypothetical protein
MIRYFMQFNDLKGATLPDTTQEFFFGAYGDKSDPGSAAGAGSNTAYLTPDTWYKLVYTYDGISARFYVNGVLNSTSPLSVPFTPNSMNLEIGRNNDPYSSLFPNWFNGAIDEIRIYNRALPQQAITQLVNLTD